jgi:hypothetical protein
MWVAQAEAARTVNVSKQRVNELVRQNRLSVDDRKRVNLEEVQRHFKRDLDPSWPSKQEAAGAANTSPVAPDAEGPVLDQDTASARRARARREEIQAQTAEYELKIKQGLYLPKHDIEEAMVTSGRRIRQQLDAIPGWADEIFALCAQGGSAADVRRMLKEKARQLEQATADSLSLLAAEDAPHADAGA